jgi:hypothetical protein
MTITMNVGRAIARPTDTATIGENATCWQQRGRLLTVWADQLSEASSGHDPAGLFVALFKLRHYPMVLLVPIAAPLKPARYAVNDRRCLYCASWEASGGDANPAATERELEARFAPKSPRR